jgi:hypothetical protein
MKLLSFSKRWHIYSNSSWNTFFDELDCDSCAEEAVQLFPDLILTPNGRKYPLQQHQAIGAFSHPDVLDPSTKFAKKFNRKFRVPFPIFELLVQRCEEANIFEIKSPAKVHGSLRKIRNAWWAWLNGCNTLTLEQVSKKPAKFVQGQRILSDTGF